MDALRKITVLPANRMEKSLPQMAHKGRLQEGAERVSCRGRTEENRMRHSKLRRLAPAALALLLISLLASPLSAYTIYLKNGQTIQAKGKYRLDKGEALLYSWKATGRVNSELHAEPDGAPRGYAESYEKRVAMDAASGTLTAPFSGIHGWYWENPGTAEVTVTLSAAGFYNMSHEFRKDAAPKTKMFQYRGSICIPETFSVPFRKARAFMR